MTKLFKPLISFWRIWKKIKDIRFAYRLLPEVYTPVVYSPGMKQVGEAGMPVNLKKYTAAQLKLFGNHGEMLLKFLKSDKISFEKANGEKEILFIQFNNKKIRVHVYNYDNLQAIEEIFINQVYDFHSNESYVVCDMGMNIGLASLYFASFENVEKVYSYEPFLKTYDQAKENLALNNELSQKIEIFPYGLGNKNEQVEVPEPANGFLGGSTTADFINELPDELKSEKTSVEIKDICETILQIRQNHPGRKLILKLDCEGAEYEIMKKLDRENKIGEVAVFMVEFHFKGKKDILDILVKRHYFIMSPVSDELNQFGMLYAIKIN